MTGTGACADVAALHRAVRPGLVAQSHASACDLKPVMPAWRDLQRRAAAPCLFQSADWAVGLMQGLEGAGKGGPQPRVVTVHRGPELVAVAPMSVVRFGPIGVARAIGEPLAQYGDMLVAPGEAAALDAVMDEVRRWRDVDALVFRRMRADAMARGLFEAQGARVLAEAAAPYAAMAGFADAAALAQAIDRKAKRERQRLRRRLDELGPVTIRFLGAGPEAASAVTRAIEWKRRWLAERAITSAAFAEPLWLDLLIGRCAEPAGAYEVLVTELALAGEPIALELGFITRDAAGAGHLHAYLGASQAGYEKASPTKAAMDATLEEAFARGVTVYDLLAPADDYKAEWTHARIGVDDLALPLTAAGRVYIDMVEMRLRPWLKERYAAAPASLRRVAGLMAGARRPVTPPPAA